MAPNVCGTECNLTRPGNLYFCVANANNFTLAWSSQDMGCGLETCIVAAVTASCWSCQWQRRGSLLEYIVESLIPSLMRLETYRYLHSLCCRFNLHTVLTHTV